MRGRGYIIGVAWCVRGLATFSLTFGIRVIWVQLFEHIDGIVHLSDNTNKY